MSRTPVREAFNRLVSDGLVINRVRQGLYMIQPEKCEIEEYIDIRSALEKLSVEKCIQKITEEEKDKIRSKMQEFETALKANDFVKCNILDGEFHLTIAKIAGSTKLLQILKELSVFFQLARRTEKKTHPSEKNQQTFREHSLIADAILASDVEAAKKAVAANIETMRTNLHHNFE